MNTSPMDNHEKLDFLYAHYQESYHLSVECKNRRNKFFLLLCVVEMLNALILVRPMTAFSLVLNIANTAFETSLNLSEVILQTFLWITIAFCTIRYVQEVLQIERHYHYLSTLESRIQELSDEPIFNREGDNYSAGYPIVLNLIELFYKMFCPILFITINVLNIFREWHIQNIPRTAILLDTLLCSSIVIISWFYFFQIHDKISNYIKSKCPLINIISRWIHKILEPV